MKTKRIIWLWIAGLCLVQACASSSPPKDSDQMGTEGKIAELNRKLDDTNHRMSVLQFMVDDHQEAMKNIQLRLNQLQGTAPRGAESGGPPPLPVIREGTLAAEPTAKKSPVVSKDAEIIYKNARAAYKAKKFQKAASLFSSLAANHPGSPLADNALYWSGECYYAQKEYRKAIEVFKQVSQKYPNGRKVPDALLKIGYAYLALDDSANAKSFLKKVVKQYPFTPAATKAGEMLKRIKSK